MHGWFSSKHAAVNGSLIYRRADGTTVEVTCVTDSLECYAWPDRVHLGEVERFVEKRPAYRMEAS